MKRKRPTTIFSRMFLPLFLVMMLQSAIFYYVTVAGDTVSSLDNNAIDILTERVDNRRNELTSQLTSHWGEFSVYSDTINEVYSTYKETYERPLYSDDAQQKEFLSDISEMLFKMIRANDVNGVFVILTNTPEFVPVSEDKQSYYGLCIRDYDSNSAYSGREDLLVARCPSSLNTKLGCSLDSYWESTYSFSKSTQTGDFFYNPLQKAYENPGISADNFKYFCPTHVYSKGDRSVVSYSMPLISSDGDIYGVIGIEILNSYISTIMPSSELSSSGNGAFMLVQYEDGSSDFDAIATNGTFYQTGFDGESKFTLDLSEYVKDHIGVVLYRGNGSDNACCYISPMKIYNDNTPFEKTHIALVGAMPESELFSVSTNVKQSILFVAVLMLFVGFAAILAVSHLLTRPIKKLAAGVTAASDDDLQLAHINIDEIDRLVDAITKQNEKISQAKVRTEFLSRMSHDMRTPMNAIIGFSSPEMLDGSDEVKLHDYLGKINESGQYLLGLINEVLDMTKIDSGKMELQNQQFKLSALWSSIVPMIDELARKRNVNFVRDLPENSSIIVMGDQQRLSQIIVNLLSNSVKFTPENGTVTLSVKQSEVIEGKIGMTIIVSDTGIGMSDKFMKRLYEPFVQEHSNREGTGLGLSIVHQLVELMGGTIDCRSEQGHGTEFKIKLNLSLADKNASLKNDGSTIKYTDDEIKKTLFGRRILLCEDHPLNQQIACKLLEKKNMIIDVAENGSIGVEKFKLSHEQTYDAILMDIRMPVMDGLEATRAIRNLDREDAKRIPIIAMTANAFSEDREMTAAVGMNAHLAKPIEPEGLYQTLTEYIKNCNGKIEPLVTEIKVFD